MRRKKLYRKETFRIMRVFEHGIADYWDGPYDTQKEAEKAKATYYKDASFFFVAREVVEEVQPSRCRNASRYKATREPTCGCATCATKWRNRNKEGRKKHLREAARG